MKNSGEKKKHGIFFYMTIFLVACIIATLMMSSFVLARYTTGTSGTGVAKIDNYNVNFGLKQGTGTEIQQFSISAAENTECSLTVTNSGSVAISFEVILTNETNNLSLSLTLKDTSSSVTDTTDGEVKYESSNLAADGGWQTIYIIISLPTGTEYNSIYREIDRISVTVVCTQVAS